MAGDAARKPTTPTRVFVVAPAGAGRGTAGRLRERPDTLVTEEPLQIRIHGPHQAPRPLVVTMRTPGHDFELAAGFAFAEGIVRSHDDLARVAYCTITSDGGPGGTRPVQDYNTVTLQLRRPVGDDEATRRFTATASCGVCGKATLEDLAVQCDAVGPGPVVPASVLVALPERLRDAQAVFARTGGLHAAGLFAPDGTLVAVREDVGRHNALDKLVGRAFLDGQLPLCESVLAISGRVSYEIVQKAAMAGIPVIAAVSAPSSLAVDTARRFGQTLVAFVRDGHANVYTHPERVEPER